MANEFKKVNIKNLPIEAQDKSIKASDFKLVQKDKKIHDKKFESKPTTFFKDCLKRFGKNKSSVVATVILGVLILMAVLVPTVMKDSVVRDTSVSHPDLYYLEPKLFDAGTGFWDGTKKLVDITVDTSNPNKEEWGPDYETYNKTAISNLVIGEEQYTKAPNKFAHGGFVQYGYFDAPSSIDSFSLATSGKLETFNFTEALSIDNFVTYSLDNLKSSDEETKTFPSGYVEAESALYFVFNIENDVNDYEVQLTDYAVEHDVGGADAVVDVKAKFDEYMSSKSLDITTISSPRFEIRVKNAKDGKKACALVKSLKISSSSFDTSAKEHFESCSFIDGNDCCRRSSSDNGFWKNISNSNYTRDTFYLIKGVLCSFTYDTYEAALGRMDQNMYNVDLDKLQNLGVIRYFIDTKKDGNGNWVVDEDTFECTIVKPDECPLLQAFTPEDVVLDQSVGLTKYVKCQVLKYKLDPYNLTEMPKFLLGTDKSGKDMFIYVFEGLGTSLLLGVATTLICFVFGLIWGSICGYFGGTVDLVMERLTDILSGIPWIVVMTLTIIKLGSNFFTFALALCLTGWIGTAATTRTQFYRFRGREYVLASRTLGASHGRLIAKHILPNAMGTIITSAVLMVPSVIFSEATISYLGLGFKNLASLGVILSDNQIELTNHPYLLIFPSVIIALLMISFNLFGNGLRDAVNPSLKGEGE